MGLLDREWFREARLPNKGSQSGEHMQTGRAGRQTRSIGPEDMAKAKNVPPAHAVLAARYEVAIRATTKKTFAKGFLCGVVTCAVIFIIMYF